jgi:4-alpha-glucanotransferase
MSSRKRTSVPLTEKKKYAQMILKGASRSTISDLYRKKYNSELSERTFRQWKKDSKSILEAKSNHEFIKERKKSSSMQKFEEKIKLEEYDVASSLLEKEEEEELIEHFLGLQIETDEAAAQMEVQEEAPFQIIEEKSSRAPANAPKKQLKITSFFK